MSKGMTDLSFGLNIARMIGFPDEIIQVIFQKSFNPNSL